MVHMKDRQAGAGIRLATIAIFLGLVTAVIGSLGTSSPVLAEKAENKLADGDSVDVKALMKPGPLKEYSEGKTDAPVTIIEYSSLTCPHCSTFHIQVMPELKKKYIDTGKVRYILREFPLDNLAAAGFMVGRCASENKKFALVKELYYRQKSWAFVKDPIGALEKIAKQAGFTKASFEKCLQNQKLLDKIAAVRNRGSVEFNVDSTPTLFVNGRILRGAHSLKQVEALMGEHAVLGVGDKKAEAPAKMPATKDDAAGNK